MQGPNMQNTSASGGKQTILVVEDEMDIQELICYHLRMEGFQVERASAGDEALRIIQTNEPNLVVLDLMLPGISGLEVLKNLRFVMNLKSLPVIIASARTEESDIITGLELGADDYLPKPFSPKVLTAKVKALLRRVQGDREAPTNGDIAQKNVITPAGLTMDPLRHTCSFKGEEINFTATEFALLYLMVSESGRVFTRNQLISTVKGSDYPVTERSIDVQIASLRRKLGVAGEAVKTVWGIGYKYQEQES
ncbi:MAG: response regulator transcription factor [Sphaerochaetaceae bacterium]|nr:response regulator transcription factor [Sphaerochaetaceae bacterium]